ncbi:universal stress protein [Blastococcus sp. SYSU D00820]
MTLVAGTAVEGPDVDEAPLRLAALLARTGGEDVVVTTVTARGFPDPRVDREYRAFVARTVAEGQAAAVRLLAGEGVAGASTLALEATSVPAGLVEAVRRTAASLLVLGPASRAPAGRFAAGSVTGHLLHSSPVPLALAPRSVPGDPAGRVTRLTCAWAGTERSREALAWTRRTAAAWGVPVRLVTFAPERAPMLPSETGLRVEAVVAAQWAGQAQADLDAVVAGWEGSPAPETLVARGRSWAGAVAAGRWTAGDVLVIGSSRLGPLARVFLGSTATQILRAAPVPTVVVPV